MSMRMTMNLVIHRIKDWELGTRDWGVIINYQLPITNYQLPITNYQLPILLVINRIVNRYRRKYQRDRLLIDQNP